MEDKYKIQVTLFRNRYIHGSSSCDELTIRHPHKDGLIILNLLQDTIRVKYVKMNLSILEKTFIIENLLQPELDEEVKKIEDSKRSDKRD